MLLAANILNFEWLYKNPQIHHDVCITNENFEVIRLINSFGLLVRRTG